MTAGELWTVGHLTVDDVVMWDGTVNFRCAGGAALYAALGGSILGTSTRVAVRVGAGYPRSDLDRFEQFGVSLAPSPGNEASISQWVLYEQDGTRTYVLHPGSGSLDAMSPDPADYEIPGSAAVHLAQMPVEHQAEWSRAVQGLRTVTVDPHQDSCSEQPEEVLGLASQVSAFLPSEIEAAALAGKDPVAAVQMFRSAGAPIAAVKLGSMGSVVATDEGVWSVPAVPVRVVDTTGAGDAYCGAFSAALAAGSDGLAAARIATAAASLVVEVMGTSLTMSAQRDAPRRAESLRPVLLTRDSGESVRARRQPTNRRM